MDKTLLKGLRVLETLAARSESGTITALSQELGLTKSNTHRTLQTLVSAGYVRTNTDDATYECTLKLFEVASLVTAHLDVRQVSDPYLQRLARETQETVHLSVLEGLEIIYINKVEGSHPVRAYSTIGGRAPAYCVATGKALLAWQPAQRLAGIPDELRRWTDNTFDRRDALLKELAETRRRGFSVNKGEWRDTVGGAAAPIFDARNRPIASIGITAPLERMTLPDLLGHGPLVIRTAQDLSRRLGANVESDAGEAVS